MILDTKVDFREGQQNNWIIKKVQQNIALIFPIHKPFIVPYRSALAITGTIKGAFKTKLPQELALESLKY